MLFELEERFPLSHAIVTGSSAIKVVVCSLILIMVSLGRRNIILSRYNMALSNFYYMTADEKLLRLLWAYYNGFSLLCILTVVLHGLIILW